MRARFPAVAATLGAPRFESCASAFLAGGAAPAGFAGFLSSALADLPARDLVADLARLEHALAEVREHPGGDPPPLTALPVDGWEEARLTPIPALRLLDLDHDLVDYRAQLLAGGDPGTPAPRRCRLLVWRRGGRIRCAELTADQHAVLSALEPDSLVELNLRAANAYQLVLGARTEEEASRIARHLAEAGERDRAAGFFATSGLWCLNARRLGRAVSDLTSALDLADLETRSPEELAEWVAALGRAVRHVRAGVKIPELVQRVATHFETHPSVPDRLRAAAAIDLALVLSGLHRYREARRLLQGAVEKAAEWPDLVRAALTAEAEIAIRIGEFKPALFALDQARRVGAGDPSGQHRLLVATAQALAGAGQLDQALAALDAAEKLCADGDPVLGGERDKIRALILGFRGDWQGCARASEVAAEQMRSAGLVHEVAVNLHNQGDALLRGQQLPRAYATLQASLAAAEEIGSDRLVNLNQMLLAYLDALSGAESANRALVERIAQAEAQRWTWDVLTGRYLLGKLLGQSGDVAAARAELELTQRMAASMDNRLLVDDCARALAELG